MAKVSVNLGYTLQVRPYESARFEFSVADVDTDAPIEPQLEAARETIAKSVEWLENRLYEKITESGLLKAVKERPVPQ